MTEPETYMHGNSYEHFIRRAFNCERGKHGAETSYLKYLLMADLGKNHLSQPYNKQLLEVKTYLIKAVDKLLTRKPTESEKTFLLKMRTEVENSGDATSLVPIIKSGLDNTIRYRDM
ncbi:MAG: hypothetical protein Q8K92_20385 [Leadbetterella sp.]|jgi:hypothetical protein|nr:hypothetical protein [Leadbetterella sp.]